MDIKALIAAVIMFVFCALIKIYLHVWGLPLIILVGTAGFILLMVGLFKSKFTNVQVPEEQKQQVKVE